jgi:hypothetical protein
VNDEPAQCEKEGHADAGERQPVRIGVPERYRKGCDESKAGERIDIRARDDHQIDPRLLAASRGGCKLSILWREGSVGLNPLRQKERITGLPQASRSRLTGSGVMAGFPSR